MKSGPLMKFLLLGLLFANSIASAQEKSEAGFADFLFQRGEYYRAITEYYRMMHATGDTSRQAELLSSIGGCYYAGGDYAGFLRFHDENNRRFRVNHTVQSEMHLLLGKSYYQLGRYEEAAEALEWSGVGPENPMHDEFSFTLGITRARTRDVHAARAAWGAVGGYSALKGTSEYLLRNLEPLANVPDRTPFLAGIFSAIIPGGGYLYAGRPGTAIASLLINGLLVWAISDAVRHEQYGMAATAGFLGIGWYIGNIIGSVNATREYNEQRYHETLDGILKQGELREYVRRE